MKGTFEINSFDKEFELFQKECDKEFYKQFGFMFAMTAGLIVLVMTIHHFENKEYEKYLETGRKLTKADGVSKSRGKYYAFCPKCGRRCANPQIIKENSHINTCIFQCYSCNKDFEKQFDSRILK